MAVGKSMGGKKDKKFQNQTNNPIEILKDFGTGIVSSVTKDVIKGVANSATDQLGFTKNFRGKIEGTLNPGDTIDLSTKPEEKKEDFASEWLTTDSGVRTIESPVITSEQIQIQTKIEEILKELKILSKTVEKVSSEAAKVGLSEVPQNAGVYHLNFFEWVLKLVKAAREKVEESGCWLKMFQSRKQQKMYWAMFKKHGTSFGLSEERSVSTQVG